MVLLMTVEPGFGGQEFLSSMLPKIRRTKEIVERCGTEIWIQVDGGITEVTIEQCVDAGANVFVAGSAVFRAEDPDAMVVALKETAERRSGRSKC